VPEQLHGFAEEPALGQSENFLIVPQEAEDAVYVADLFLFCFGSKENIVKVYQAALPLEPGDRHVEPLLESSWGVRQAERHVLVLVRPAVAH